MTSGLRIFNNLPRDDADSALRACCASRRWVDGVAAARPYAGVDELLARSDAVVAELGPADLDEALTGHPRIGERTAHGSWSASEQRGMATADDDVQARIADGNRAYEERFGHVYLVRATGRSAGELLAILTEHLGNDPETERAVTKRELAEINRLRLGKLLNRLAVSATISTHVLDAAAGRPAAGMDVVVEHRGGAVVARGTTDADGRVPQLADSPVDAGDYRIVFDTGSWFAATGRRGFYPEVAITFTVVAGEHHHVPLLLSPYAYSTYRGS